MDHSKLLKSTWGCVVVLAVGLSAAAALAAGPPNHAGGGSSSAGGTSNKYHAATGLENAYGHSHNPIVDDEYCLHTSGCILKSKSGTTYTSLGQIARAAKQAGISVEDFIANNFTLPL